LLASPQNVLFHSMFFHGWLGDGKGDLTPTLA